MAALNSQKPRRRISKVLGGLAMFVVVLALSLPVAFTVLLAQSNARSFLVEAETTWLEVDFAPNQGPWRMSDAIICKASETLDLTSDGPCGVLHVPSGDFGEVILNWSSGSVARIMLKPDGVFQVTVQTDTPSLGAKDFVITQPDALQRTGTLRMTGQISIGQPLADGATTGFTRSGSWQAREAGAEGLLFRSSTETVQQGDLSSGTRVRIWRPRKGSDPSEKQSGILLEDGPENHLQALSFGHISQYDGEDFLNVSLVTEFADNTLSVKYDGIPEAVHYKPDWVDITVNSPALIAIAAIFPLLASLGLILSDLFRRIGSPEAPMQPAPKATPRWHSRRILRELRRRR